MTSSAAAVLEFIVRLTLFISVILVGSRMLLRRWPVLVGTAQEIALLGLLVLPFFTLFGLSLPWRVLPSHRDHSPVANRRLAPELPAIALRIDERRTRMPDVLERDLVATKPAVNRSPRNVSKPVEPVSAPSAVESSGSIAAASIGRTLLRELTVWRVLTAIYLSGSLLLLVRIASGLLQLRRLVHESPFVDRSEWLLALEHWQRELGLVRRVRLVSSRTVTTPMTFTWGCAFIVIPNELEQTATPEERSAAILHELVHVHRSDFVWQLLVRTLEAIYWFHPLLWVLARAMTSTRELVCDAICARRLGTVDYARALIELAGRYRRSSVPAVGLAMARSSKLRRRLSSLSRVTPVLRSRPSGFQATALAAILSGLVVCSGALSPVAAIAQPGRRALYDETPQNDATLRLSGRLLDDRGEAFQEIEIQANVTIWYSSASKEQPKSLERAVKTDRDGRFALEQIPGPKPESRYEFRIRSAHFVSVMKSISSENIVKGTLNDLNPSRLIARSARVLDPNGQPVAKAVVTVVASGGEPREDSPLPEVFKEQVETDATGKFTVRAPAFREYGLTARSDVGAIARLVVPEGTGALADIQIARGVAVRGRVLSRDGQPITGCVVSMRSNDNQAVRTELTVGHQELNISEYRITDSDGRFRFSPVLGDFLVHLVPKGDAFRSGSAEFARAIDPPPFVPLALRLDRPGEKSITLIEAPTAKVNGTIRSSEGKPAAGIIVQLLIPPEGGNAYLDVGQTKTDSEGRYSIAAPIPLQQLIVTTQSQFNPDGTRLQLRPAAGKGWSSGSAFGMLVIDQFDGDRNGLDGVLAPEGRRSDEEPSRTDEASAVSPDLLALEREIKIARDAYLKANQDAQSQEQRDRAYDLFPGNALIHRCLALEAKHRGSRTAIGAMHWIMRMAAMNSDNPATEARARLISVLRDHYLANADVDLLIDEFPHGDTPLEAEQLLRKVAAESPHDYVRATALYELAEVLVAQAYLFDAYKDSSYDKNLAAMIAVQTSERTKDHLRREGEKVKQIRSAYRDRGTKVMTTEAERLYEQVATQFAGVRSPQRWWEGPEDIRLHDDDRESGFRPWTLAELADAKRFQMTNLRLGQQAPILEGADYFHKRIRLSDFIGKIVVLTVTTDTVGDKEMYARCSHLLDQFKGQPVVCLSVVPTDGDGGFSVRDIVRKTGINWPIIRDGRGDRLAHRWCQQTFPEAYIIDSQGLIRFHEAGRDSVSGVLVGKIKELLNIPGQP